MAGKPRGRQPVTAANFYTRALDEAERLEFQAASHLDGVDNEIALMRVYIKELVREDDVDALARAMNSLCRLVATRYAISKKETKYHDDPPERPGSSKKGAGSRQRDRPRGAKSQNSRPGTGQPDHGLVAVG